MYAGGDRAGDLVLEVRRLKELERLDFWVTAATSVGEGPPSARVSQAPVSRGESRLVQPRCRLYCQRAPARTPARAH